MTITSIRYLEPKLSNVTSHRNLATKPLDRIWQASEPPFKGYQPPRSEAYEHSSSSTAIVIDNGLHINQYIRSISLPILNLLQVQVSLELAGRLKKPLEFHFQLLLLATEIAN